MATQIARLTKLIIFLISVGRVCALFVDRVAEGTMHRRYVTEVCDGNCSEATHGVTASYEVSVIRWHVRERLLCSSTAGSNNVYPDIFC